MHLIIHTQYYPPETGAPQNRLHEIAIGMCQLGHQVTVLTAMPSYPTGHIFPGYKGWLRVELIDGVRVVRTAIYPTQSTRTMLRLFSYISFVISSLLFGAWMLKRADYLLTESPPLFLGVTGLLLSKWKGAKWIFNISDLWPGSVVELGLLKQNSTSHKLSLLLEKRLYLKAWLVTCQSKTILENIRIRFPLARTYHLSNGVDTKIFSPAKYHKEDGFHVVYAGLHGLAQGLEQVLIAANELRDNELIDFIFIGDGPEKKELLQRANDLQLPRVQFLDPVPKNNVPNLLDSANVLVVPLKVQLTGAVPSKLYEAMAMGKPVVLIAEGEAANVVRESACGIVVAPGDVKGLARAIQTLGENPQMCLTMGNNGRMNAISKYDRKSIIDQFDNYLNNKS